MIKQWHLSIHTLDNTFTCSSYPSLHPCQLLKHRHTTKKFWIHHQRWWKFQGQIDESIRTKLSQNRTILFTPK